MCIPETEERSNEDCPLHTRWHIALFPRHWSFENPLEMGSDLIGDDDEWTLAYMFYFSGPF